MTFRPHPLPRRALLRATVLGGLGVLTVPVAAACGSDFVDEPDPLLPLLRRAQADAAAAEALAGSVSGQAEAVRQVAAGRTEHARVLRAEVRRLNRPEPEQPPDAPARTVADVGALGKRLTACHGEAAALVQRLPAYRAGLVGSVAAGCAALQQLTPALGASEPGPLRNQRAGQLDPEAVRALQDALAAEHAAVWVYGLVNAFLPDDFAGGIEAGADAHRDRRDLAERVLSAAGATPRPPEAAYIPPDPVTDEASAVRLVITAETDAAAAWHGVLERTGDGALRRIATRALTGSATRGTRWRMEAGTSPAAVALPGRSQS